jgi:malic enzyme
MRAQHITHTVHRALHTHTHTVQRTQALGLPTFNDDIQCTAAVVLAAVLGGCRVPGVPPLAQQTFLFFGAGQVR